MARCHVSPCSYGLYVDLLFNHENDRVSLEVLVRASLAGESHRPPRSIFPYMQIIADTQTDRRTVIINGNLDTNTAPELEAHLDVTGVREIVVDFTKCPFISSAGIRTLLMAHRRMAATGGKFVARNLSPSVREVFDVTGISKVITITKTAREISIEGRELLSSGVCGECFRLDNETVVKLYKDGVDLGLAELEKRYAQEAFVLVLIVLMV